MCKAAETPLQILAVDIGGFYIVIFSFCYDVFEQESIYPNLLFRMLEFFIGIILASISREFSLNKFLKGLLVKKVVLCLEFAALLAAVTEGIRLGIGVGNYMLYSWVYLPIFSLMLLGLSQAEFRILGKSKAVRYLSSISYAFYLSQFFMWPAVNKIVLITGNYSSQFKSIVSFLICISISILMHELVEKPCKKIWLHVSGKR